MNQMFIVEWKILDLCKTVSCCVCSLKLKAEQAFIKKKPSIICFPHALDFCHSEEKAALRDALKESLAQEPSDENDGPERKQQNERFLREFPELKKKLEDHIRKL